jgi:proteasome lid subunit RPN8/RPN11
MLRHVQACAPEEACGLIGGVGGRARRVVTVENLYHSPVAYKMNEAAQVEAMMAFEREGWDLLAIFHSHPGGPPGPSQTDVREAYYPDSLYIIISPGLGGQWGARAFQIDEGRVTETELIVEAA